MPAPARKMSTGVLTWMVAAVLLGGVAPAQVVASGTSEQTGPADPAGRDHPVAAPADRRFKDTNEHLAEAVANRVPEFAGAFLTDDEQTLNVLLTGPADRRRAERARDALAVLYDDPSLRSRTLNVLPATFGWHALTDWNLRLRAGGLLGVDGVVSYGIDVFTNRIEIGVEDPDRHGDAVMHRVEELGVPADAVAVRQRNYVVLAHHIAKLEEKHNQLVGGLQINVRPWGEPNHSGFGRCTLGVPAILDGVVGVITASHCSQWWGGPADGSLIGQPSITSGSGDGFGREARDGQWEPCPPDNPAFEGADVCRWADVAFFARHTDSSLSGHDRPIAMGRIAWPAKAWPDPASTLWDGRSAMWDLTSTRRIIDVNWGPARIPGTNVAMVGWRTGRSAGQVTNSCIDRAVDETDRVPGSPARVGLRCQVQTDFRSFGGDSGAPVFRKDTGEQLDATLQGMFWGLERHCCDPNHPNADLDGFGWYTAASYYSPMAYVRRDTELGSGLKVCYPGFCDGFAPNSSP